MFDSKLSSGEGGHEKVAQASHTHVKHRQTGDIILLEALHVSAMTNMHAPRLS